MAALKQEEKTEIFYYQKFDILLRELEINVSKMASALHYDPSYISKIRTGKRTPSDVRGFAENVCGYIVMNFSGQEESAKIAALTGCGQTRHDASGEFLSPFAELALCGKI